tara:strand:+ start:3356 stop:4570 length:1215 start_codon:yes stop_codon:yes gene_type:complete
MLAALPLTGKMAFADIGGVNEKIDLLLQNAVAAGDIPGAAVALTNASGTYYSGAFGTRDAETGAPIGPDTVMAIASMTKPITSVAVMQLVERGALDLDEPVSNVLPELASIQVLAGYDASGKAILRDPATPPTLRQLLTHTSGFTYPMWNADLGRYYQTYNVPSILVGTRDAFKVPLSFDPGTQWEYGIGIDWAGLVVEAVTGVRLGDYLKEHVTGPLGMTSTDFKVSENMARRLSKIYARDADGNLVAAPIGSPDAQAIDAGGSGLHSTLNDYLKFVRMILNKGSLDGQRILAPETIALMSQNNIGDLRVKELKTVMPPMTRDAEFYPGVPKTWGLGFMITEAQAPTGRTAGSLSWSGLFNTYFWIDPARDVAGVMMMQIMPFVDERALQTYYDFETAAYASL